MAQNLSIAGASYNDVPSINVAKQGGGTASFIDVSDTTATAGDVASGKTFYAASGAATAGTLAFSTIHTGSSVPSPSLGVDGDIYLQV